MESISWGSRKRTCRRSAATSSRRSEAGTLLLALAASLAALALAAGPLYALDGDGKAAPYVVITRDGHRIDAMEKPVVDGARARLHVSPQGTLAVIPADSIDWPATEKFNAPPPAPPKPAAVEPAPLPAVPPGPGHVIEMRITGVKRGGGITTTGEAPGARPGAAPADPKEVASALATLGKEYETLKGLRQEAQASKAQWEQEVARLQAEATKVPSSSVAEQRYESPTLRSLQHAKESLAEASDQIAKIETRMAQIRDQVIQLGGAID